MACEKGSSVEMAAMKLLEKGRNPTSWLVDEYDNGMYYVLLNNSFKKEQSGVRENIELKYYEAC